MQSTTRLDLFENPDYDHGPLWKRVAWTVVSALFFQTWFPWPSGLKAAWLRGFGAEVGKGVVIKPRVSIKYPWRLEVGDHAWIGERVWLDNLGQITIGPHCCLSQGALLLCGNHDYKRPAFDLMVGDITLEVGVWIGAKASVAPGVRCRSHAVLTMGSTLTSDAEAWSIYQGNPAAKVKDRTMHPAR